MRPTAKPRVRSSHPRAPKLSNRTALATRVMTVPICTLHRARAAPCNFSATHSHHISVNPPPRTARGTWPIQRLSNSLPRGPPTTYEQNDTHTRTTDLTISTQNHTLLPQQQTHFLAIRRRAQNPRCSPTLHTTNPSSHTTTAATIRPRPETDKNTAHTQHP